MAVEGVIFDFNGTLFWDTYLHNEAWDCYLEHHGFAWSDEEKNLKIHGKTNQDIFQAIYQRALSEDELGPMIMEKETIYQTLCRQQQMDLAPGAVALFGALADGGIPFTIATGSGKENVDFYFELLHLERWFRYDSIVYNDGSFRGKPHPDSFLLAADKLGIAPSSAVVFEDSISGIQAAENAGVGKIVIVNSNSEDYSSWPYKVITHFDEVRKQLLPQFRGRF
nr:HAD family phosphatase [uncultured Acetobacteroides sp.]